MRTWITRETVEILPRTRQPRIPRISQSHRRRTRRGGRRMVGCGAELLSRRLGPRVSRLSWAASASSTSAIAIRKSSRPYRCSCAASRCTVKISRSVARDARQSRSRCSTPPGLEYRFFCNSGTEAVEARSSSRARTTRRSRRSSRATKGFHGKSYGALSASAKAEFRRPFGPMLPNIEHVPFDDLPALARHAPRRAKRSAKTSARCCSSRSKARAESTFRRDDYLAGRTRALRRVRRAAHPRRSADRHGAHRQDVLLRALRRRARHSCVWRKPSAAAWCPPAPSSERRASFRVSSTTRSCTRRRSAEIHSRAPPRSRRSTC